MVNMTRCSTHLSHDSQVSNEVYTKASRLHRPQCHPHVRLQLRMQCELSSVPNVGTVDVVMPDRCDSTKQLASPTSMSRGAWTVTRISGNGRQCAGRCRTLLLRKSDEGSSDIYGYHKGYDEGVRQTDAR